MREAKILFKEQEAGVLTQLDNGSFTFRYHDAWMADSYKPGISLTFPKIKQAYYSEFLFPFFYNMLPEGSNKQVVCKLNQIDADDYFGLLMATAKNDSIGAVRVVKSEE
jgi:serine/threonine-protein kinase HipA